MSALQNATFSDIESLFILTVVPHTTFPAFVVCCSTMLHFFQNLGIKGRFYFRPEPITSPFNGLDFCFALKQLCHCFVTALLVDCFHSVVEVLINITLIRVVFVCVSLGL